MPNYGDFRYTFFIRKCPNGAGVQCTQLEIYTRIGFVFGYWKDVGTPVCAPCPVPAVGKPFVLACCFAGTFLVSIEPLSPPGLLGELPDLSGIMGETPPGAALKTNNFPCLRVDATSCGPLLENMRQALLQLRAMGRLNEAQTQEAAIACLDGLCKSYGFS